MSTKSNSKPTKSNPVVVEQVIHSNDNRVHGHIVEVAPKAKRAKKPVDPNKEPRPKAATLSVKYKTMLTTLRWFLDPDRIRSLAENNDPTIEDETIERMVGTLLVFNSLLPVINSVEDQIAFFGDFDLKVEYKQRVLNARSNHKKMLTKQRNAAAKAEKAAIKAALKAATSSTSTTLIPVVHDVVEVQYSDAEEGDDEEWGREEGEIEDNTEPDNDKDDDTLPLNPNSEIVNLSDNDDDNNDDDGNNDDIFGDSDNEVASPIVVVPEPKKPRGRAKKTEEPVEKVEKKPREKKEKAADSSKVATVKRPRTKATTSYN